MRPISLIRCALPALAVAGLLAGCSGRQSGGEGDFPRVVSLKSGDPQPSASSAADDQRPLIPLDATDEERNAFGKAWMDCIRKEGGAGYEEPKMIFKYEHDGDPKAKRVRAACLPTEPETYEERQKRTDVATFRDNQRQWQECARKAGYKLTTPDENGEFGITEVGPNGDFQSPKMENCRKEAFKD